MIEYVERFYGQYNKRKEKSQDCSHLSQSNICINYNRVTTSVKGEDTEDFSITIVCTTNDLL